MILRPAPAQDIVLIGATGDLARRKLLPAIYNLYLENLLPERGSIIGYARTQWSDDDFRSFAADAIREHSRSPFDDGAWAAVRQRFSFVCAEEEGLAEVARRCGEERRVVYLAVPPSAVAGLAGELAAHGLATGTRLVAEKPFGYDLASAGALGRSLCEHFDESQIFRIDHYLGKETVQNILVMRFGNTLFERSWNRDAVDHVQITVAESLGMEGRGAYYEEVGALRDIMQNHTLQVLSLLTMEPPTSFDPEAVRDERVKLLRAIAPVEPRNLVRGQYAAGQVESDVVPGYLDEAGVATDSQTETYVALKLGIDNWRWGGVPFFLRAGKRLPRPVTEVHVQFRAAPVRFFEGTDVSEVPSDHLTIRIQPDEGISFNFLAKRPGPAVSVQSVRMNFSYDEGFMSEPQEAYERLLLDVMTDDHTLFLRQDGVEEAWRIVEPALQRPPPVRPYRAGSWGPDEADELMSPREWHLH